MKTKKFVTAAILAVTMMAVGAASASAAPLDLTQPNASNLTSTASQVLGVQPTWKTVTLPNGTVLYIDPPVAMF